MTWLLTHIPQLIFLFVLFSVIRAVVRAAQLSQEHKATTNETDEQRRVREIQERIRKKIAERRGGGTVPPAPLTGPAAPSTPVLRPGRVPPLEPFGGPSRRLVIETMRRAMQPAPVEPPPIDSAAVERQQKLAEQIRALDRARVEAERQAAQVAAQREKTAASPAPAGAAPAGRLGDLRDRHALRRAFVLREVLGAPVALR